MYQKSDFEHLDLDAVWILNFGICFIYVGLNPFEIDEYREIFIPDTCTSSYVDTHGAQSRSNASFTADLCKPM
jgi:hypothetical protein